MSMVSFMPWCRIEKTYDIGEIQILTFQRHKPIEGIDNAMQCRLNTILATYKTIEGKPVDRATLVRYRGKSLLDDLNDDERETIHELVALACFCGLARREYFNSLGPYCNSECFALYIQKFDRADFTAIATRRREGQTLSGWPIDDIAITVPVHCQTVREARLDEVLLKALVTHRTKFEETEWGRWQNAISCFNQANTDSETMRFQVEWVLFCSAFEHLLNAKSEAKDVAARFSERLVPSSPILAKDAKRRSDRWIESDQPLRYEWMREFYRIRGDFAHGNLRLSQPFVWQPLEHIVLAAIAFPLLVRSLLASVGRYSLSDNDRAQINSFEALADEEFLRDEEDRSSNLSIWSSLVSDSRLALATQRAVESLEARGFFQDEEKNGSAEGKKQIDDAESGV